MLVRRVGPLGPRMALGPGGEISAQGVRAVGETVGLVDRPLRVGLAGEGSLAAIPGGLGDVVPAVAAPYLASQTTLPEGFRRFDRRLAPHWPSSPLFPRDREAERSEAVEDPRGTHRGADPRRESAIAPGRLDGPHEISASRRCEAPEAPTGRGEDDRHPMRKRRGTSRPALDRRQSTEEEAWQEPGPRASTGERDPRGLHQRGGAGGGALLRGP